MSAIAGTNVIAPVVPFDTADTFPSHVDSYGKGGHRCSATLAERNAIPADRRSEGMLVYVAADAKTYQLSADMNTWVEFTAGHSNANDPTSDQKAALAGTDGAPSAANPYVTDSDSRMTDSRTPTAHNHDASYSALGHNHDAAYSAIGHNHDLAYSAIGHNHAGVYAPASHTHDAGDINAGTLSTDRFSAYADLTAESKIGTGAAQVAAGDHTHAGFLSKRGLCLALCVGFTPAGTGADAAEVVVPYSPADGTTGLTWNVRRIDFRVSTAGGSPSARVEKSTVAGAFSAATVGTSSMGDGDYESNVTAGLGTVASGNKLRLNVINLGTATAGWTVQVTLEEN